MKRNLIGLLLMGTAVLHIAVGLFFYAEPLSAIIKDGFYNAIAPSAILIYFDRDAAFWFLMTGIMMFVLGQLIYWTQSRTGTLPASLGWWLLGLSLVGVVLMPLSGLWLLIPQAFIILWISRQKILA